MAVPMDFALGLMKEREALGRQRHERGAFDLLKPVLDLLLGRAVDALVCHLALPVL